MAEVVAAIDCGTNTARLLISHDGHDLVRREVITRLGADLDRTRTLAPEALDRLGAALGGFADDLDRHGVATPRVVATSAARQATNRSALVDLVRHHLHVELEVLTGGEEAALSFAGAVADLDPADGPFCVVDIGGGSTEFAVGSTATPETMSPETMSLEMGSVRFTERYVESDPPAPEELVACLSVAEAYLSDLVREMPAASDAATYVAVAGTAVTVAAVEIGCEPDDLDAIHGFRLDREAAEDVFRTLVTESLADRRHNPGLHPDRAEVIVAGSALLVETMRFLSIDELVISVHDSLDALVAAQVESTGRAEPRTT
jgi:exopolyphosphatase / guanosine-5'-triphosphate,3'-diphosphate pyrophosphatase